MVNSELLLSSKKILKFWVFQFIYWFVCIFLIVVIIIGAGISLASSQIGLVGVGVGSLLIFVGGLVLLIVYAFKAANFLSIKDEEKVCLNLKKMKCSLILDIIFSFIFPILCIFTKVFFYVLYRQVRGKKLEE